ncbi:MAG: fibronectin type III domain-containing protein, partial [Lachnospiraceae bacterium]|nr:fibronectin type III domain-containing protein [Lachnospiraceae bacterium]
SDEDNSAKYVQIRFRLSDNYKKACNIYDKLVKKLDQYYTTGKDNKNTDSNNWRYIINGYASDNTEVTCYVEGIDYPKTAVLSLSKINSGYEFTVVFIHPDYLKNPTEFAKSMLKSSGNIKDADEFVFDEAIELDDPVIKSLTNKKGKKFVVKYSGDSSFDNITYKIQVSTSKKFTSIKEFETNKTSVTISNLKKGKTYYVRVMYTVTEDGETTSSSWSKAKSITIKK